MKWPQHQPVPELGPLVGAHHSAHSQGRADVHAGSHPQAHAQAHTVAHPVAHMAPHAVAHPFAQAAAHPLVHLPSGWVPTPGEQSLHHGAMFRVPRHGRTALHHRAPTGGAGPPRRRPARARSSAPGQLGEQDEVEERVEDDDTRRARLAAQMQSDTSLGGEGDQGSGGERGHEERRFALIARTRLESLAATDDQDAAQRLLSRAHTAQTLEDLAPALRTVVAQGRPALAGLLARVARAWQLSRGEGVPRETTTLASVKAALVHTEPGALPLASARQEERRAAAALWLPVYLLNLSRPRLPEQRQQAADRLALIQRGLSRVA